MLRGAGVIIVSLVLLSSCGGPDKPGALGGEDGRGRPLAADVAELEIRASGVDRFVRCPPPGDLGQHWIPEPFPWSPPAVDRDGGSPPPQPPQEDDYVALARGRSPTELAAEATHREFRACFRRGLVHDRTQDGRVAIVLRVGPDGRVVKVEEYAACELAPESIACMRAAAARLRFPPPPGGSDTITIPAVFTSRDGVPKTSSTPDDGYTAGAYVTIEGARPALHACEESARRELRPVEATGTFTLDVAADGRVTHTHIDPWTGDKVLLACAARELERLTFAAPPGGKGTVLARLNFNPRQGTR